MLLVDGGAVKHHQQIVRRLQLDGGRLPDSGTTEGSGAVSGPGPDLDPSRVLPPLGLESGRPPCGASGSSSSGWVPLQDPTSVLSVSRGVEAVGSEVLFTSDVPKDPLDEAGRSSLGGLQGCMRH